MRGMGRRAGFTLVELLVVIGIIAILIAVTLPIYGSVIAHAKIARCSTNLRAIGVAMLAFAGDNNDNFPESGATIYYNNTDPTTKQNGWCQQIEPYLSPGEGKGGKGTVFQCPDSSTTVPQNATYSYFNGAHAAHSQTGGFAPVNLLRMLAPSRHIIAGDIAYGSLFDPNDADKDDYTQDPAFNGNTGPIPIHLGSVNLVFADGHVENARKFDPNSMTTVYGNNNTGYLTP